MQHTQPFARFGERLARDLVEVTHDPADLDKGGWWAVVMTYAGALTAGRFDRVEMCDVQDVERGEWTAIPRDAWASSMSRDVYIAAVEETRAAIAAGTVYQTNICRVLSTPREGRDLLDSHSRERDSDPSQAFYAGVNREREVEHDSTLYATYRQEEARGAMRGDRRPWVRNRSTGPERGSTRGAALFTRGLVRRAHRLELRELLARRWVHPVRR